MSPTNEDILHSIRWSGALKRYHTWPVHRQQTIAEHTWQVWMLYNRWFNTPRVDVTYFIMHHDCGEIAVGDIPFGAKRASAQLKELSNELEKAALKDLGVVMPILTDIEFFEVKLCDLGELVEFANEEVHLGNVYAIPIVKNGLEAMTKMLDAPPDPNVSKFWWDPPRRWLEQYWELVK